MKKALPLFLLSWLFLMFSCKQDDFEPEDHAHGKTENKQVSFREFMELQGSNPEVQKIKKYFQGAYSGLYNKGGDSINWEIDTTSVTQIITPEITTYTFRVIEYDAIPGFRNVIIREHAGETKIFLAHYPDGIDFENHTDATVVVEELESLTFNKISQCYGLRFQCLQCGMTFCNVEPGWVLISQPCGDDGGGGFCLGCPSEPSDPFDPGTPTDPGTAPIGGGGGSGGNDNQTPCQSLNYKLATDSNFKNKIIELKGKVTSSNNEHGYVNHNPKENPNINSNLINQYTPTTSNLTERTENSNVYLTSTFGYMHTHPNRPEMMGVPSTEDVHQFVTIVKTRNATFYPNGTPYSTNDVYGIIVGNHGVYALKLESLNNFGNNYDFMSPGEMLKFWEDFERKYEKLRPEGAENNNRQNNERSILKMLMQNYNILGVSLYRANDNLTGWSKLSLNDSGNPVETPCN